MKREKASEEGKRSKSGKGSQKIQKEKIETTQRGIERRDRKRVNKGKREVKRSIGKEREGKKRTKNQRKRDESEKSEKRSNGGKAQRAREKWTRKE